MNAIPYRENEIKLLLLLSRSHLDKKQILAVKQLLACSLDWSYLLDIAQRGKLVPLVFQNLSGPFASLTDEANYKLLKKTLERYIRSNLLLTQSMIQLVNHFRTLNITLVPFKGPVLSQTAYQKPFHRYFEDLDFVVAPQDFEAVCNELLRIGLVANYLNDPNYYRQSQFAAQQTRMVLDLHYALTPIDCFIQIDTERLISRLDIVSVGGATVETFNPADTLIILCVDAAKGYWRSVIRLVDIAELIRHQVIDWPELYDRANQLRCTKILDLGLFLSQKLLDAPIPLDIQRSIARRIRCNLDDETIYRQVFKLKVDGCRSVQWHRFNMQTIGSLSNRIRYLYRLSKFSMRNIPTLKARIRT